MKQLGRYEVIGKRAYREHQPGCVFEATIEHNAENRAIARGSIRLIRRIPADLEPGSYRLPDMGRSTYPKAGRKEQADGQAHRL